MSNRDPYPWEARPTPTPVEPVAEVEMIDDAPLEGHDPFEVHAEPHAETLADPW